MTTKIFVFDSNSSADIYARIFNTSGQVFDFNDTTFKALSSATTPYVTATERGDMNGTGKSGYTVSVDLEDVNNTATPTDYVIKAYDNASPADADVAVSGSLPITIMLGELVEPSGDHIELEATASVTSTAGTTLDVSILARWRGHKLDLTGATIAMTVREVGSGVDLFSLSESDGSIRDGQFELQKSSPGFTSDRQYCLDYTVTLGGVALTGIQNIVVIG